MTLSDAPDLPAMVFDHTGFITPDIDASVRFWEEVMGFEAQPIGERRKEWIGHFMGIPEARVRLVHLYGHGTHIEFIAFETPGDTPVKVRASQGNVAHICLRTADVDALRAHPCRRRSGTGSHGRHRRRYRQRIARPLYEGPTRCSD